MDYLSSKYMLPIGGMFTVFFVLFHWGVPSFIDEFYRGIPGKKLDSRIAAFLLLISSLVIGFIILNEIISKITGTAILG